MTEAEPFEVSPSRPDAEAITPVATGRFTQLASFRATS